jgi:hypothetical protein
MMWKWNLFLNEHLESDEELDLPTLNNLCGDLVEGLSDEDCDLI